MRKTTLLTAAGLLLAGPACTLAQTIDPNVNNTDTPFIRNIRPDRPGQTITTSMLRPGQVQLEMGTQSQLNSAPGTMPAFSTGLLRVGFFGLMELRAQQSYLPRAGSGSDTSPDSGIGGVGRPTGFAPLTLGAKMLASSNQDTRSQVSVLAELTLPGTGAASFTNKVYEPAARLLVSQQLGKRFGLEANLGFRQRGFKAADTSRGQYLGTLALNGPLGDHFGFFAETYTTWQRAAGWRPGLSTGIYWRPAPGLRFDVTAGGGPGTVPYAPSGPYVGGGLSLRLPH
ncbi:transporter [Microvirga sp. STR05]|uniref:Transporter n=1 Tax=Hymenobacter duratus TaxID=2771356 RepID=A0ABR8JI98_9BACT|nr:transporter [Hymenobacter duratus]MBD2715067.1 transporter [Hymenobacter duratus]MBR7949973.1 transporter [Microvirga sp. STR05]